MRLNFTALTVSAALCLAGMTTFAPAAPISTESSDSTGSLLSRIFGQSSNDTSNAKPGPQEWTVRRERCHFFNVIGARLEWRKPGFAGEGQASGGGWKSPQDSR